ncbi:hypothetical protein [Streptomyces mangrovisoli]|uniref:Uncharacterized protein n=1 Tax=Streptomyces mangrovisoli TaxID=1428628 RepID=A0A1J4NMD5_9ACTN|nr:hypothetical protein [Streptomyces mangrovisoli]OIJ63569.1 hypothetical protein WN71_032585 [Streptomyces mangrovisoli]
MTLKVGQRVRLATDLRLAGAVAPVDPAGEPQVDLAGAPPVGPAVSVALAAGVEGVVERVDEHQREQSHEVREYLRLKSLLDDYGPQMPPASRKQAEQQVGDLEADWVAHQRHMLRATVRVRLDNGFILDDAPEEVFAGA